MAPASFAAGFQNELLVDGKDSVAAGQTSATDAEVPTGSIVKFIEIQFACSNLVSVACYVNCTIQYSLATQNTINPDAVGGNAQRNQVLHQDLFVVGADQNSTHKFRFKIPKKYQRVREGVAWKLTWANSATVNRKVQVIYKFYR